jgi:hypothetical protein
MRHLPKEHRERQTWQHVAAQLESGQRYRSASQLSEIYHRKPTLVVALAFDRVRGDGVLDLL